MMRRLRTTIWWKFDLTDYISDLVVSSRTERFHDGTAPANGRTHQTTFLTLILTHADLMGKFD